MRVRFGEISLDIERRILQRDGEDIALEPRAFDLLAYLVHHRGRAVQKDELLETIWDGRTVSEAALTTAIRTLRKAIDREGASVIKTLPKVGYRFDAAVDGFENDQANLNTAPTITAPAPNGTPLPASTQSEGVLQKPSIAVVPFEFLSINGERDLFTEGLTEDLITALSQFKEFSVAGRRSSLALRESTLTTREIGEQLAVRYLLKGSVRRAGGRMRITAQLIEAATDHHVWARIFDRDETDIFDVQDDLSYTISCVIQSSIEVAEQRRVDSLPGEDLSSWECYHRAYRFAQSPDMAVKREAMQLFERSIELDPNFVEGAAMLVRLSSVYCSQCGPTKERDDIVERAQQVADHALRIDPHHDLLWAGCAGLYAHLGEPEKTMKAARRVTELNPRAEHAFYSRGLANMVSGNYQEAIECYQGLLKIGEEVTIRHPAMAQGAAALVNLGRYQEAIDLSRAAQLEPNADFRTFIAEISALGHLGERDQAKSAIESAQAMQANIGFELLTYCHPFDRRQSETPLYEGLALAAFPG